MFYKNTITAFIKAYNSLKAWFHCIYLHRRGTFGKFINASSLTVASYFEQFCPKVCFSGFSTTR